MILLIKLIVVFKRILLITASCLIFSSYCLLLRHAGDNLVSTEIFLCSNKFIAKRKSKDKVLQREIQYCDLFLSNFRALIARKNVLQISSSLSQSFACLKTIIISDRCFLALSMTAIFSSSLRLSKSCIKSRIPGKEAPAENYHFTGLGLITQALSRENFTIRVKF